MEKPLKNLSWNHFVQSIYIHSFFRLISIDPVKDRDIEFSMKAYSFVLAKHLEIDENIEKHKMFN